MIAVNSIYFLSVSDDEEHTQLMKCAFIGDDPVLEHTRWFPNCDYISRLKGSGYVEEIRQSQDIMVSVILPNFKYNILLVA